MRFLRLELKKVRSGFIFVFIAVSFSLLLFLVVKFLEVNFSILLLYCGGVLPGFVSEE